MSRWTGLVTVSLGTWQLLDTSPVLQPTISNFDVIHISGDTAQLNGDFTTSARDWCLSVCESSRACAMVTLDPGQVGTRCVLYPDTHTCGHSLRGQDCRVLLREPAQALYLRTDPTLLESHPGLTSVLLPGRGLLLGENRETLVGTEWRRVSRYLGVPYAAAPTGAARFSPPAPLNWTGQWNATNYRPSCLQPGHVKAHYSTVSEDCLFLNVFVPKNIAGDSSVLLFFHNSGAEYGDESGSQIDGSWLAAIGNIIVVTASYRVG
uniref:Carboxylesterase type B domain-containing protein n=1 Tax=Callorhinchus milii TaxID=7868 RepID=A0A4W3GX05_CALMI